jgi:hypothetical protein
MSIFSFNQEPIVVPTETIVEEPIVEATVDYYEDVSDEDYTTAEEPHFGDDV